MLNTLIQWDCLEVLKTFESSSIDLTVTSPPYDNLRTYNWFSWNFEWVAKELYRVTKDWWVVVWVVGDQTIKWSESWTSFKQALFFKECWFNLHDTMIYAKQNPVPYHHNRYNPSFEYMFVFSKGKPKIFNPLQEPVKSIEKRHWTFRQPDGTLKKANTETPKISKMKNNIFYYVVWIENDEKTHPAKFPSKLAEDHILSWSNEWDTVLDPFAGSGTTLKMAKKNNRKYIGIEISEEYCNIIRKRLALTLNI